MAFYTKTFVLVMMIVILTTVSEGRTKYSKKQLILQRRETNAANFVRLVLMRLVYGIASTLGLGQSISGVLNGVFVPPGVDDYDDVSGGDILDDDI